MMKRPFKQIIMVLILVSIFVSRFICSSFGSYFSINTKAETIVKGTYAIISNESTDETTTASTGTFSLQDYSPLDNDNNLDLASYKMDLVRPLNKDIINNTTIKRSMIKTYTVYNVGNTKTFWTYNILNNSYNQITATLKSSGIKSNVWVKTSDYNMTPTNANKITAEFDNNISPKITSVFGQPSDIDSNSKVNILCFDIIDGFSDPGGYVAGYFDPSDLYAYDSINNPCTNQMEVFYIDTDPGMGTGVTKDVTQCYGTIAHEFQHLVNFNQNGDMDIWLQEALSEAASQVYSGQISTSRIDYYNSSALITSGSSLLKWTGTLDNYSLAYLFSQYLKEQVGIGDSVFTEIMQSTYNDYRAVEQVIKNHIDQNLTFSKFMTSFRAALFLKKPTGLYGFKGNTGFNSIIQKIYTGGATNLYGGGAVVIASNANGNIYIPSGKGATINYFIIQDPPVITIALYQITPTNEDVTVTASTDVGTLNTLTHTFTENGSFNFEATNLIGDITTRNVTITNIDKIAPIITIGDYITTPTNQNITVTATTNEGTLNSTSHTFIQNGSFEFIATDDVGNVTDKVVTITNIDKVAPIITIVEYSTTPTNQNITVTATTNEGTLNSTSHTFIQNGSFEFVATDEVGNVTNKVVTITNIDKVAPIITIVEYSTTPTNQNITVTATTNEGTLNSTSHTFIQNGSFEFVATDDAGNVTDKVGTITNIYKLGDTNGDNVIDILDLVAVKIHLLGITSLSGINKIAGDIYGNGDISISDLIAIKKHILGVEFINQEG